MPVTRAVVLVEGESDKAALNAFAGKRDLDMSALGVDIVSMGGASPLGDYLYELRARHGSELTVAGLYDEGEIDDVRRGLERIGADSGLSAADLEIAGFFGCSVDLEDELIRALGPGAVEAVIDEQGELRSLRSMQNQPAWRGRPVEDQLKRFIGTKSGRKVRYGHLLVEALDLDRMPRPLVEVLAYVTD